MKRCLSGLMAGILLFSLAACGGQPAAQPPATFSPATPQEEFSNCVSRLEDAEEMLQAGISEAEALAQEVTEADVADSAVLTALQTALEKAKNAPAPQIPEIGSTSEEIQQQMQGIMEQEETLCILWDELAAAVFCVTESQQEKQAEYENMSVFDAAKSMGYAVEELSTGFSSKGYYVSFTYNDASFLIGSQDETNGDILFYGKPIEEKDLTLGTFAFISFYFDDKGHPTRDSSGHWTFTDSQKAQLLNLLSGFQKSGPISFMDAFTLMRKDACTPEMCGLMEEFGLDIAFQLIRGGYRFMLSDGKNLAYFIAIYSEADLRPSDKGSGIITYQSDSNTYDLSGIWGASFPTDYVNSDHHLVSEPERVEQLRTFFTQAQGGAA